MDAMQLAQMKRQVAWLAQDVKHHETALHTAELALEADKKKVEELKKQLIEKRHMLDMREVDVKHVVEEDRRNTARR